ncbi:DNA-binding protein [Cytobacillus sp. IB215316]|uniref:DNA-binding protein n=1 Tax=Cytobacillus sp. IB215316 TaxID=3097354 RepID=UPI002A0D8A48|nr:DNA-binding protein [Cytobacillus sp. IB215316]MDX8362897.1 DNA-binding protein [Cytobacillus sp. IB215316]
MDYMSAKEAGLKWGISKRRVQILCAEDRINGASKVGMVWIIPQNAEKPEDERLKINSN